MVNILVAFANAVCYAKCRVNLGLSSGVVDGLFEVVGGFAICGDYPVFHQFPYGSPTVPLQFPYSSPMEIYTVPLHFLFPNREVWRVFLSEEEN